MADRPPRDDGGSLARRWARRKARVRAAERADDTPPAPGAPGDRAAFAATGADGRDMAAATDAGANRGAAPPDRPGELPPDLPADVPPDLPPVESLTAESDFSPFLDRKVPAHLRRAALRRLWGSSPTLANLDGLNDYDGDFRSQALGTVVRTVFQAGQELVEKTWDKDRAAAAPAAPPREAAGAARPAAAGETPDTDQARAADGPDDPAAA